LNERISIDDVEGIFSGFTSVESWSFNEFYQFELMKD
jgi:hypothetical protein